MMAGDSVQFLLEIVPPYYILTTTTGGYVQILTRNHKLCFSASVFIIHSRWLCEKCANVKIFIKNVQIFKKNSLFKLFLRFYDTSDMFHAIKAF